MGEALKISKTFQGTFLMMQLVLYDGYELFQKKLVRDVLQNRCSSACKFILKKLQHKGFSLNFVKFLRTRFLQNISKRLLLLFLWNYWPKNRR